jgi:hypothetical protein
MNDTGDKAWSMAALQLAQWMFLHLVGKGVISQEDAKRILQWAVELNIRGNQDHVQVAKIFERMLSGIAPRTAPKPEKEAASKRSKTGRSERGGSKRGGGLRLV